jgi:hypothetical protein
MCIKLDVAAVDSLMCSFLSGEVVPIPTRPEVSIEALVVLLVIKSNQ